MSMMWKEKLWSCQRCRQWPRVSSVHDTSKAAFEWCSTEARHSAPEIPAQPGTTHKRRHVDLSGMLASLLPRVAWQQH